MLSAQFIGSWKNAEIRVIAYLYTSYAAFFSAGVTAHLRNMPKRASPVKWQVVFIRDTHAADNWDTQEGKRLSVKQCIKNTDGWQVWNKLAPFKQFVTDYGFAFKAPLGSSTFLDKRKVRFPAVPTKKNDHPKWVVILFGNSR